MPTQRSVSACIAEIKSINQRFRELKNKDGPVAEKLIDEKDRLIDEMGRLCDHPSVLAVRGSKGRRICPACGFCESSPTNSDYKVLTGRPTTTLSLDDYLLQEGQVVKKLGINI